MTILAAIFAAVVCGIAGALAAGAIAAGAVKWYRISHFEGQSGFFVVFIGLGGGIAGAVIGAICASVSGGDTGGHFFRGVGFGLLITLGIAGVAAVITRALADIPPEIDGEDLFLIVEVRCPPGRTDPPANEPGDAYLTLCALVPFGQSVRKSERGPLWKAEARLVDGRWVMRGAVEIFTSRGRRLLSVSIGDKINQGFFVPLPRHPGEREREWSDWLPRLRPGVTPPADMLTYRFKVQRWSESMKTETFGPFEIDTITRAYNHASVDGRNRLAGVDTFRVRCAGQPVKVANEQNGTKTWHERFLKLGTLDGGGEPPALLVNVDLSREVGRMSHGFFLIAQTPAGDAKVEYVADGGGSDTFLSLLESVPAPRPPDSFHIQPNRLAISPDALYRVGYSAVLDTRNRAVHKFTPTDKIYDYNSTFICVSPGRRAIVRHGVLSDSQGQTVGIVATDFVADRTEVFTPDRARTHFTRNSDLNHAWIDHHFTWQHDGDGVERLVARDNFTPIPFRGVLELDYAKRHCYRLDCVGEAMRAVVEKFLTEKLGAVPDTSDEITGYTTKLRLDGARVGVSCSEQFHFVTITMEDGITAERAVQVAAMLDAELATGRYDELFLPVLPSS